MTASTSPPRTLEARPGPRDRTVRTANGEVVAVPEGWELLPPGDALVTRKVKTGPHWVVSEKVGRRVTSRGVWAPAERIEQATRAAERQRSDPAHGRALERSRARRAEAEADYVVEFARHVEGFLRFHERHAAVARQMAEAIASHATPVGSGTVARTQRIPVAERAEAATIAWMRHQTTGYDHMHIARVKGERREVRRKLAERSRELLQRYRRGEPAAEDCPLARALAAVSAAPAPRVLTPPRRPTPAQTNVPAPARAPAPEPEPEPRPAPVPARPSAAVPPVSDEVAARAARQAAVKARLANRAVRPKSV